MIGGVCVGGGLHVCACALFSKDVLVHFCMCLCLCGGVCGGVDILFSVGVCLQCTEASRPRTPPWSLTSVNTDSMERQRWPWVNTKANT